MKQFDLVDCSRGAPMGRPAYRLTNVIPPHSVHLFRVHMCGDYDDGGAYWGAGKPIYCARIPAPIRGEPLLQEFTRASSRAEAAKLLGLTNYELMRGV